MKKLLIQLLAESRKVPRSRIQSLLLIFLSHGTGDKLLHALLPTSWRSIATCCRLLS
jgi:hypothetical protein